MKSPRTLSAADSLRSPRALSPGLVENRAAARAVRPRLLPRMAGLALVLLTIGSMGATVRSPNFLVTAPTVEVAREVAERAEECRRELALEWLGRELPRWSAPCTIAVEVRERGASGATSFVFDRGRVSDWEMTVRGSLDRILDTVLPHEISHVILASDLRRPVPRWADEGAAQLAENEAERNRQHLLVDQWLRAGRTMPLRTLLSLSQYPTNGDDVAALYAKGFSVTEFLVGPAGRARYLAFLRTAQRSGWDRALDRHYGFSTVEQLEERWMQWVLAGRPDLAVPAGGLLADAIAVPAADVGSIAQADRTSPRGSPALGIGAE